MNSGPMVVLTACQKLHTLVTTSIADTRGWNISPRRRGGKNAMRSTTTRIYTTLFYSPYKNLPPTLN